MIRNESSLGSAKDQLDAGIRNESEIAVPWVRAGDLFDTVPGDHVFVSFPVASANGAVSYHESLYADVGLGVDNLKSTDPDALDTGLVPVSESAVWQAPWQEQASYAPVPVEQADPANLPTLYVYQPDETVYVLDGEELS